MATWPDGVQCAFTMTIHFDAETVWTSRDPRNRGRAVLMSQGRYGARRGVHALLGWLDDEGLQTTFCVPGWVAETYPEVARDIKAAGHHFGHHGYEHEREVGRDPDTERALLLRGLESLDAVLGVTPRGYCSPGWEMTDATLDIVAELGFEYSVNMMDDHLPYLHDTAHGPLVELPVHWLLDDAPFRQGGVDNAKPIAPASELLGIWLEELYGLHEAGGLFNLTIHPQCSGRPSMVRALRELVAEARSLPGMWFATCEELTDHVLHSTAAG